MQEEFVMTSTMSRTSIRLSSCHRKPFVKVFYLCIPTEILQENIEFLHISWWDKILSECRPIESINRLTLNCSQ